MKLKEITPHHLRCGIGQCPSVYEHGSHELIIIGKIPDADVLAEIGSKIGNDEYAICISRAMLANLEDGRKTDS